MTLDNFADAFAILADAPGGIARLRKLILQLAVQGRLVEQDPNDEPANTLFEQIQNKKLQLIKANRLRKSSPLPEVSFDEMFFDLPRSWMWVRLGELGDWGAGATPDRKRADFYSGTIRWLKSGELNDGYVADSEEKITELALAKCSLRVNAPGDILIAMYGATIGKLAILQIEATTNQAVCACTCFTGVYNRYLFYLLRAFRQRFTDQGAGGAQPNISREKIIHTVAPLPPLAEQRRIVERVDELMARCDTLEQQGAQQTTQRRRLLATLIDGLLHANDAHEAAIAWARLRDSFDMLLDTPELVAPLRQAVLQLAVQGRLVAQDERDEPASVLLERVRAEKARLVRECKIKKVEPSVLVIVGQHLFAVPKSWAWSTLQSLVFALGDGLHGTPEYSDGTEYYFINGNNLVNGKIIIKPNTKKVSFEEIQKHKKDMSLNTVLVSINGTLGNVAFYNNEDIILGKSACYFNLSENIDKYYIKIVIESQYFISYALRNATGSTISNLSLRAMRDFPVPLPPLAEQRRIVAKVDGLMALCDALEAKLRGERAAAERLADAVVRAVVGSEQRTPRQMELAPSAATSAPTNGIGDLKNGKLVQAPAFNDDK